MNPDLHRAIARARAGVELVRGGVLVVVGLRTIGAAAQLLREARTPPPADAPAPPAEDQPAPELDDDTGETAPPAA